MYKSALFSDAVDKQHHTMTFSGVGAHSKNSVVEHAIQTIVSSARTMMLHQVLYWPAHFDMRFSPFALEYAVYLWNHLPDVPINYKGMMGKEQTKSQDCAFLGTVDPYDTH